MSGLNGDKKQIKLESWEPGDRKMRNKGKNRKLYSRTWKEGLYNQSSFVLGVKLTQNRREE